MSDFKILRKRGKFLFLIFLAVVIIFLARSAEIQILKYNVFKDYADSQQKSSMLLKAKRGSIYDCRGRLVAYDMDAKTYSVNPKYMGDQNKEALKLSRITGKSKSFWLGQFKAYPGFLYVARRVLQKEQSKYEKAGVQTLKARDETVRVYPFKDLASEVIGRTDMDNCGVSGLEKYYEGALAGRDGQSIYLRDAYGNEITSWEHTLVEPVDGSDIYLAFDVDFQQIVEEELGSMLDSCGALYGSAVFMELSTGGVVSCATVETGDISFRRCRSIVDRNEPGSTAKIIPMATVFQEGIFEPNDLINVEGGRFRLGQHVIRDDHPYDVLRCDEVGIYSSNIGVSKMGLAAGAGLIYKTLIRFGFGEKTGIDFPGEISGLVYKSENWTKHFLANVCFGYGIAVTGLQIARAYGAVANDGQLLKPYFAEKEIARDGKEHILNSKKVDRIILDKKTCNILDDIFQNVVHEGTAQKAANQVCTVAGKTGTALRTSVTGRGYDPRRSLASFVGYFPADNPRFVGIVMFDEPKTSIYGGEVSAPVFTNIVKRFVSLPRNNELADVPPKDNQEESEPARVSYAQADDFPNAEIKYAAAVEVHEECDSANAFPDFRGKTIRDAYRLACSLKLKCDIYGSGVVQNQQPDPGTILDHADQVILYGE